MEYVRTITAGEAEIKAVFQSLPFRLWSRLDDMTSQMYFELGGRRTGTNLELGRVKDFVCYNAVAPDKQNKRKVTFTHPKHNGGERVSITLGDPMTFDNFPEVDTDVEYMATLPEQFTREVLLTFPALYQRYAMLWRGLLTQEEEEAQVEEDPTESEEATEEEDGSTKEPSSTGERSNAL